MSRKIFGPQADAGKKPADVPSPSSAASASNPLRARPILAATENAPRMAQPVGAIGASLSRLSERGKHAEDIEKQLAAGLTVIELDTDLIEPSFVSDRMPLDEAGMASLVEDIRANTQLSPVLVRPHPEKPGRYQTAFGHRRIKAVSTLGQKVRAIVREMTDEEMVIAQGQENNARKDLSYIEKARFAERLEKRFSRETIMQAMSVYKSDLSNMLSVAHRIPDEVTAAIGPAPKIGRRGWIDLADQMKSPAVIELVRRAIADPALRRLESDARFNAVIAAIKAPPPKAKTEIITTKNGQKIARLVSGPSRVQLIIDRKQAPGFADFLVDNMDEILAEFEKQKARP